MTAPFSVGFQFDHDSLYYSFSSRGQLLAHDSSLKRIEWKNNKWMTPDTKWRLILKRGDLCCK